MPLVSTFRVNGADLRALRVRRGLSLTRLAEMCPGRHAQSIRKLETARPGKLVSQVFAAQIANALGADVSEFTDKEPEPAAAGKEAA